MLTTYISAAEANYYFPNDSDYSAAQKTNALKASFGLVNAYINKEVAIPVISVWNGEDTVNAPETLKVAQGQFYEYILKRSNDGSSDELEDMYNATANRLRGIQQGEVSIPDAQTYEHETGWSITERNCAQDLGDMYVERYPKPALKYNYRLVVTASGYGDTITFDAYNDSSATAVGSYTNDWDSWTTVDNKFNVRFVGYWDEDDEVRLVGVPSSATDAVTSDGPVLRQTDIAYNHAGKI